MKISLDNTVLYDISEIEIKSLHYYIHPKDLLKNISENIKWNIESFCQQPIKNLKNEWLPILFKRYSSIPTSDEELLKLIFSQPDYRDKEQKEAELKAKRENQATEI